MPLLDACERKAPEIIVHQLQEAHADQREVLGILAVGLETVKESVSNYMQHMQKYTMYAKYAKRKQNMHNMQKHGKYAEHDLDTDFAGEELVDALMSRGVELWVNCVEYRTNSFVPQVLKPPATDWLAGLNEVPAPHTLW